MPRHSAETRRARPLLGTFVEIVLPEPCGDSCGAINGAFAEIEEVQRRMSFHDAGSVLSEVNREAARRPVRLDAWTFEVLQAAAELHRVSKGAFDVTIAPRLQTLGFLPGTSNADAKGSFDDVELGADGSVRFHHPDIQIDLGGIAKGFAVDRAVDALQRVGIPSGLVNAGGDLRAFGTHAFPVSIRHPDEPATALTTIPVRQCAIATSAHYFADRLVSGSAVAPIVHPRRDERFPLPRSATVRAKTGMIADALTKVVMLCAEESLPVLTHFGADACFVSTTGEAVCNEGWNAALHHSA